MGEEVGNARLGGILQDLAFASNLLHPAMQLIVGGEAFVGPLAF